ncbi:hypothetical protein [Pontibacter anaerobius]|uniref:Outer membrane protein beta-barrel domain-containing protein n=1 Tax=Pontibacter anaerobius TaxID=2993940 RepID=A0ABT3RF75_9BACT|nr:hypothetical protein [Pontibacter anaerobius]MCX2740232.1 hypothetical protein [Pontibacter anaerobius]
MLLFAISFLAFSPAMAQQAEGKRNSFFLELGGNGGFYSLNYDRILMASGGWSLAGRMGAMYYGTDSGGMEAGRSVWLAAPLEVSWLRGRRNHRLELGLGVTPLYQEYPEEGSSQEKELRLLPVGRVGYRFQRAEGGMFYKAGFTPMAQFNHEEASLGRGVFLPWFGLAVGYTLKQ